jgi:hypothetical protein
MPLKVVPAGDERCDIHNQRPSPQYICESCVKQFGIEPSRVRVSKPPLRRRAKRALRRLRARLDWRHAVGAVAAILVIGTLVTVITGSGGGGSSAPSDTEVAKGLGLVPVAGGGWQTADGACNVVSIETGVGIQSGEAGTNLIVEVTNEAGTVGAVVTQRDFSLTEGECVRRVGEALRSRF